MNDFRTLCLERESCREYLLKPVPQEELREIVATAILAPTASNRQSWRYMICTGETAKKIGPLCEIAPGANVWAKDCPAFIVISSTTRQSEILGMHYEFPIVDAGIAIAYLCLAASERGLGTCIIGAKDETTIKEMLGIDAELRVHCIVSVGYPAHAPSMKKDRLPFDELVREFD